MGLERAIAAQALFIRAGRNLCAIPLGNVEETMRLLSCRPFPGMPAFVRGLAVIRGEPVPVVDLACLLDGERDPRTAPSRMVLVHCQGRKVAVGVDVVLSLGELDSARMRALPPVLGQADPSAVSALGVLDRELVFLLEGMRLVPESAWAEIETMAGAALS